MVSDLWNSGWPFADCFCETKVAPTRSKSLPTLELLTVYTAFKALHCIRKSYSDATITDICIFADAQVVLLWLIKNNIKIKNIFAGNRIQDINDKKIKYDINIKYKYVHTSDSLARGITLASFEKIYEFWPHGLSTDLNVCLLKLRILFPQKFIIIV